MTGRTGSALTLTPAQPPGEGGYTAVALSNGSALATPSLSHLPPLSTRARRGNDSLSCTSTDRGGVTTLESFTDRALRFGSECLPADSTPHFGFGFAFPPHSTLTLHPACRSLLLSCVTPPKHSKLYNYDGLLTRCSFMFEHCKTCFSSSTINTHALALTLRKALVPILSLF